MDIATEPSDINLANVTWIPKSQDKRTSWLFPSHVVQPSLLGITRAAFRVADDRAQRTNAHIKSIGRHAASQSLLLADNPLGVEEFATMYSALRYGCVYNEILLARTLCSVDSAFKRE